MRHHRRPKAAEPKVDCAILARWPDKRIIPGVLDLGDMAVQTPALVDARWPTWRRSG